MSLSRHWCGACVTVPTRRVSAVCHDATQARSRQVVVRVPVPMSHVSATRVTLHHRPSTGLGIGVVRDGCTLVWYVAVTVALARGVWWARVVKLLHDVRHPLAALR